MKEAHSPGTARYILEVVLEGSKDSREDYYAEQSLYGHDEVTAYVYVTYKLMPNGLGSYYHDWRQPPEIKYKATTFYSDQDGGDHEREVELTDEEDAFVMAEVLRRIKQLEKPIIYLHERAV
jgi:hypothetical protein